MKCAYRNCGCELPPKTTSGRNKKYCNGKCKRMEFYFIKKDKENGKNDNHI